jgi:methylenetetrahydrofolate dehydrogenase (NADP+)/methenyltetrahydrofolate cyclohydrolase
LVLLDGAALARQIRRRVRAEAEELRARTGVTPKLAAILVGNDPASEVYVANKARDCARAGLDSTVLRLPADTPWPRLQAVLEELGADPAVHGILVQQPLPPHLDPAAVAAHTDPRKDVDGLHPLSAGHLLRGEPGQGFVPCTPLGVLELLRHYDIPLRGRRAVVVGRSTLVGKPLALLLLAADATVTVCHSRTPDLGEATREADVICLAAGRPGLLRPDMVRPGAVVVDVGINRVGDRLVGDADPAVAEVAGAMTPVPGGVGPMTRAMLLHNTLLAARRLAGAEVGVGRRG